VETQRESPPAARSWNAAPHSSPRMHAVPNASSPPTEPLPDLMPTKTDYRQQDMTTPPKTARNAMSSPSITSGTISQAKQPNYVSMHSDTPVLDNCRYDGFGSRPSGSSSRHLRPGRQRDPYMPLALNNEVAMITSPIGRSSWETLDSSHHGRKAPSRGCQASSVWQQQQRLRGTAGEVADGGSQPGGSARRLRHEQFREQRRDEQHRLSTPPQESSPRTASLMMLYGPQGLDCGNTPSLLIPGRSGSTTFIAAEAQEPTQNGGSIEATENASEQSRRRKHSAGEKDPPDSTSSGHVQEEWPVPPSQSYLSMHGTRRRLPLAAMAAFQAGSATAPASARERDRGGDFPYAGSLHALGSRQSMPPSRRQSHRAATHRDVSYRDQPALQPGRPTMSSRPSGSQGGRPLSAFHGVNMAGGLSVSGRGCSNSLTAGITSQSGILRSGGGARQL